MKNRKKSKIVTVVIIISWLITLSPYLLFFFIEWYYVLFITSLIFSIQAYNNSTKSNYSSFKAVIITLIFNIFGSLYVHRKMNKNPKASFVKAVAKEAEEEKLKEEKEKEQKAKEAAEKKRLAEEAAAENFINELKEKTVFVGYDDGVNKEKDIVFLGSHRLSIQLLDFNNENLSKQFLENHIASEDDIKHYNNLAYMHEDFLVEKFPDIGIMELVFFDIDGLSKISFDELTWNECIKNCSFSEFYDCIVYKNNHSESFDFLINVLTNSYRVNFLDKEFNSIPNNSIKKILEANIQQSHPIFLHMIYYDESVDHG